MSPETLVAPDATDRAEALLARLQDWLAQGEVDRLAQELGELHRIEHEIPDIRERVADWLDTAEESEAARWLRYAIRPGYRSHLVSSANSGSPAAPVDPLPDVLAYAAYLARHHGCSRIVALGCRSLPDPSVLGEGLELVGFDTAPVLQPLRAMYPERSWIDWDPEAAETIPLNPEQLAGSVVVCAGLLEKLHHPELLTRNLSALLDHAPVALLATPERERVHGPGVLGPPADPRHAREWNAEELQRYVALHGLHVAFGGLTLGDCEGPKDTSLLVLDRSKESVPARAPDDFKVLAIMTCFNEVDILDHSIDRLQAEGVDVYLIDNWSDDGSYELARRRLGQGLVGLERFPPIGPSTTYDWGALLRRVEELSVRLDGDWFVHHDVDEVRCGPWPDLTLRESLYRVDRAGFDAIDHTVLVFSPVDDSFEEGDFEARLQHWTFGRNPGHFRQVKAWKRQYRPISLASNGGHEALFEGRRVYPHKFLLKHYPIRSQRHGERKIFSERRNRWNPLERERGWHTHYDDIRQGHDFLAHPDTLRRFDRSRFDAEYLVERLSGIGIRASSRKEFP